MTRVLRFCQTLYSVGRGQALGPDLTGATLGYFRLVEQIGTGQSATVYRAYAGTAAEQELAVKVLDPSMTSIPSFRERLERDLGLVRTLAHPNILAVHTHGVDQGVTYVAMALAPGGSLRDVLRVGPISPERALAVISGLAQALNRAHDAGVVHKDVKPGNVLFDVDGTPLLADFGLARTHFGFAVGTPAYMAPEQAIGAVPGPGADVFGLGALVFEMLTGARLRAESSPADLMRAAIDATVPSVNGYMPDLPPAVDTVLFRALHPDPAERYPTAIELVDDLGRALGIVPEQPAPLRHRPDESNGRKPKDDEFDQMRSQILRVIESSLSAAIAIDERSFIVGWSAGAEEVFGWPRDKIVGRLLSSTLVPPSLREAHERGFQRYLETGEGPVIDQVIEVPALHRDGREFPIQLAITPAARFGPRALTVAFAKDLEHEKSSQRAREAKLAVAHALEGSSSFPEAAPKALEAIGSRLGWSTGALWLSEGDQHTLRCSHFWKAEGVECIGFQRVTEEGTVESGRGLVGRVWKSGEAAWIEDVLNETDEPRIVPALRSGLRAAVGVPIMAGGQVFGVLEYFGTGIRREDEDLLLRLYDLGRKLGRRAQEAPVDQTESAVSELGAPDAPPSAR